VGILIVIVYHSIIISFNVYGDRVFSIVTLPRVSLVLIIGSRKDFHGIMIEVLNVFLIR
jgi:hypothetical protein